MTHGMSLPHTAFYYGKIICGKIICPDIANGTGCRLTLFVSGCTHHCKGCFNPETWSFSYGSRFTDETMEEILERLKPEYISGITILGGEPLDSRNHYHVFKILQRIRQELPEKDIWIYTGYVWEDLLREGSPGNTCLTKRILELADVLVDGLFIQKEKDIALAFRGSRNQRIIDVQESLRQGKAITFEL